MNKNNSLKETIEEVLEKSTFDKNARLVTSLTLKNNTETTLRNIKISNAHCLTMLAPSGEPLWSGWSKDDIIYAILDYIFNKSIVTVNTNDTDNESDEDIRK